MSHPLRGTISHGLINLGCYPMVDFHCGRSYHMFWGDCHGFNLGINRDYLIDEYESALLIFIFELRNVVGGHCIGSDLGKY